MGRRERERQVADPDIWLLEHHSHEMGAVVTDPRRLPGQLPALIGRRFPERVDAVARQL